MTPATTAGARTAALSSYLYYRHTLPVRIHEVPIHYRGRKFSDGKKIGWRDGIAALWAIVKHRFV